jgi:hypothetical protein
MINSLVATANRVTGGRGTRNGLPSSVGHETRRRFGFISPSLAGAKPTVSLDSADVNFRQPEPDVQVSGRMGRLQRFATAGSVPKPPVTRCFLEI